MDFGTTARAALLQVLEQQSIVLRGDDAVRGSHEMSLGVYGQLVDDNYLLQQGDRLEIYRPLLQDPMERRRQIARERQQ